MKKAFYFILALLLAVFCSAVARTQVTGTNLVIEAHWDTGAAVAAVATIALVSSTGSQSVLVTRNLSNGRAAFQTALAANSVYDVTLTNSSGTQLANFPFTTALINPANLQKAGVDLVFNSSNNSLKSASVSVNMNF